ncbi:hypothetical protein AB4K20DRAFT_1984522 [Rhizopus microsporus]|uniref:Uncharacterized protein n=1 Tax=Rhizopus microsporus TaxID=58291 RepID=A0A1X0S140_RHIZD|nr:hypothetical protein BCV71DRAFT_255752 [Rhizopus microsporus]
MDRGNPTKQVMCARSASIITTLPSPPMVWALFDDGEASRRPEAVVISEDGNLAHRALLRTRGFFCLLPLASPPADTRPLVFQINANSRRSPWTRYGLRLAIYHSLLVPLGCQDGSIGRCFPRAQIKPILKPLQQATSAFVIPRTGYPAVRISTQSSSFYSNALTESSDSRALSTCVVHGQFESIAPSARSCRCNIPLPLVKNKRDCESSKSDCSENQPRQRL